MRDSIILEWGDRTGAQKLIILMIFIIFIISLFFCIIFYILLLCTEYYNIFQFVDAPTFSLEWGLLLIIALWQQLNTKCFGDVVVRLLTSEPRVLPNFLSFCFERLQKRFVQSEEIERSLHDELSWLLDEGWECLIDQVGHTQPDPDCVHGSPAPQTFLQFCRGGQTERDKLGVCQTAVVVNFINHLFQVLDGQRAVLGIVDILAVLDGPVILQLALYKTRRYQPGQKNRTV